MATLLSERGQPRCHGPGASPRSACLGSAPPAAIARGESFAPTQSARTSHVAARDERRLELPAPWRTLPRSHTRASLTWTAVAIPRLPDGLRLRGTAWDRAASRVPPRRGARSAAPEMPSVARITPAGARHVIPRLSPAWGVTRPTPLRSSSNPGPLTRHQGAGRLGRA